MTKNTICLWYEHDAEEAARFYAQTFPQSSVGAVHRAPRIREQRCHVDSIRLLGLDVAPNELHSVSLGPFPLRELEETGYWLELLRDAGIATAEELQILRAECDELTAIFVAILKRSKENLS